MFIAGHGGIVCTSLSVTAWGLGKWSSLVFGRQVAGKRLIELLKGVKDMPLDLQHGCRAVLLNAAEHPVARKLITLTLPKSEQDVFLGPLPAISHDYQVHAK